MRVALVHDYLNQLGGEERVLRVLADMFPRAPIYCAVYDNERTAGIFEDRDIVTSWMQNLPFSSSHHRLLSGLMPFTVESLDLRDFDLVISSTASFVKGILLKPGASHVCYLNTPTRFLWDDSVSYLKRSFVPSGFQSLASFALSLTRGWDYQASKRPDYLIANSEFVSRRIQKYYKRKAQVIYPPVEIGKFSINTTSRIEDDYYLMVGRLIDYKRFDLGIGACNKLGKKLKIAGLGPEYLNLKSISGSNVEFLGYVSELELRNLYAGAKALIWPQEEDFGIVQVEALASGCPVIALSAGGALEVVREGMNGVFFDSQDLGSVVEAINRFELSRFDSVAITKSAQKFDKRYFIEGFSKYINELKVHNLLS